MGDRKGMRPGVGKGTTIKTPAAKPKPTLKVTPKPAAKATSTATTRVGVTGAYKPKLTEEQKEEIKKKYIEFNQIRNKI